MPELAIHSQGGVVVEPSTGHQPPVLSLSTTQQTNKGMVPVLVPGTYYHIVSFEFAFLSSVHMNKEGLFSNRGFFLS